MDTATNAILDDLVAAFYTAFTNKDGMKPNVAIIYQLFIPEGMIIKNTDAAPVVYSLQQFIEPREKLLTDGALVDFEEAETSSVTEIFGNIAHRFSLYRKSGVLSGERFETEGMKTMQFIYTPNGWRFCSVAWNDEKSGVTIPEKYRNR
ncbi:hypothetical protein BRE01_01240 [Brevibacillus reuszeri]|uniref:DUF4440 domain-containing protein n=1 Tax=Brevibacillus reuszeri TaxID=54915 RepID=A0A0K9YRJ7_9BACL|nr:hypothetical protein [Brevibacillus reuszeri]KNB71306.1 hypothetical protein ADS79_21085 [Brevibacillus reuszeri]MED1857746.1 hypothetical protein [Brevibacillus reuszeri]GED66422.1 hypothetical protein BRE01_01240 [Brevibacillus reuszeri]